MIHTNSINITQAGLMYTGPIHGKWAKEAYPIFREWLYSVVPQIHDFPSKKYSRENMDRVIELLNYYAPVKHYFGSHRDDDEKWGWWKEQPRFARGSNKFIKCVNYVRKK